MVSVNCFASESQTDFFRLSFLTLQALYLSTGVNIHCHMWAYVGL